MLSTLIEIQRLKRLERTGWTLRGLPNGTESVAAHSFGVCVAAMLLADEINKRGIDVNRERVLRMALLHDWAETRTGDMPKTATAYFGAEVRRHAEAAAFRDIVAPLGGAGSDYEAVFQDYEQRTSLEARLVKTADIVDLLLQALALERAGAKGLGEFWEVAETTDFQLPAAANEVVTEVIQSIIQARATLGLRSAEPLKSYA
jgi:putative hydrolases of HD superfamily